jgi:hypothetical protein
MSSVNKAKKKNVLFDVNTSESSIQRADAVNQRSNLVLESIFISDISNQTPKSRCASQRLSCASAPSHRKFTHMHASALQGRRFLARNSARS